MRFNKERDEAEPTQPGGGFTMAPEVACLGRPAG
jgi:hypothetical protein